MTESLRPDAPRGEASSPRTPDFRMCAPVESEARAFVAEGEKKYYDARHNCWCYIIKDA